jgi:hypothetical protein
MDPRFYSVYQTHYLSYGEELDPRRRELALRTRDIIEEAVEGWYVSERIRPDAKLFLLVDFHRLLVMPLVESGRMTPDEDFGRLGDDTGFIISSARDLADRDQEEEISSHRVVDTVSQEWDNLQLTRESIWM